MSATHLHLILNHLPVLGTAFGLGLLLFGLWRGSNELKKTALGVFVIVALAVVPVYLTGEPTEDEVEFLSGISKPIIEQHEAAAGTALVGVVVLGASAMGGLIFFRRTKILPTWLCISLLAASSIVGGLMAWTANLGGQVRHTEIRANASLSNPPHAPHHD